ncbi:MAG: hypothetical protein FWH41_06705 [Treponema sp.]|nr:hypothetical protein [Treponema sp.]
MRAFYFFAFFLITIGLVFVNAEEPESPLESLPESPVNLDETPEQTPDVSSWQDIVPRFKARALIIDINAYIFDENQTEIWSTSCQETTISGRPVELKMVGANVVVVVQFTPYIRRNIQKHLVAQGQIWMKIPDQGIQFNTSLKTIPFEFDEPILFFPLGQANEDTASIEVELTLKRYEEQ